MKIQNVILAAVVTLASSLLSAAAGEGMDVSKLPPASTKTNITYATDIKPIFEASCVKCHGEEKPKGKFRLDTLEMALTGGKNGKDIVPGKSDKSPLLFAVARVGEDDMEHMPPPEEESKIAPLTKEQVGLIRAWIDQGAK